MKQITVVEEFIERMGLSAQSDGLPRIAGKIFAYFVMHGGVRSFSEIAEDLKVSRGSVSTNARLLESLGMLERITRAGDRQDYFRLSDDPYGQLLRGYMERIQHNLKIVRQTKLQLACSNKASHKRLHEMERFYAAVMNNTLNILQVWDKANPEKEQDLL